MYEYSRDYLNKLIAQSGVKMGTAKQAAMVAIIELLDENALDGLIKDIRADYNSMKVELSQKDKVIDRSVEKLRWLTNSIQEAERAKIQKLEEVKVLNLEIERLVEDKDKKMQEMLCEGMLPEERSMVLAFNAAMKLMEDRYGRRADADQISRSASNVAANWRHEPEKATGKEIDP